MTSDASLDLEHPSPDPKPLARVYGEPVNVMPTDLYIPPQALEVFLETFEGPLDLLLYLIRKQNFNILDIPLASVTRQYLAYVDQIRRSNLELASDYLLMAAMLIEIKSRMLLPPKKTADGKEIEDPRAELVRRLVGRGTESEEEREVRLTTARAELAAAEEFDVTIVNDDVRRAADELVSLMRTPTQTKRD